MCFWNFLSPYQSHSIATVACSLVSGDPVDLPPNNQRTVVFSNHSVFNSSLSKCDFKIIVCCHQQRIKNLEFCNKKQIMQVHSLKC